MLSMQLMIMVASHVHQSPMETAVVGDLETLVRRAVDLKVSADKVEVFVDKRAWWNTRIQGNRDYIVGILDLELKKPKDVVYWGIPGKWHNPRVIGIAWKDDGSPEVFFATIYPP